MPNITRGLKFKDFRTRSESETRIYNANTANIYEPQPGWSIIF